MMKTLKYMLEELSNKVHTKYKMMKKTIIRLENLNKKKI